METNSSICSSTGVKLTKRVTVSNHSTKGFTRTVCLTRIRSVNYVSDNSKAANGFRLGRWHVPDPANPNASPYVGMGNNSGISISGNPWESGNGNGGHRDGGGTTFHRPIKQPPRKQTPSELAAIAKGKELRAKLENFKAQYEQCLSVKRAAERKTHKLKPSTAKAWYMHGKGEPLYVDINSIDLSRVSMTDMNGGLIKVQLDNPIKHLSNIDDAIVYGDLYLQQVKEMFLEQPMLAKLKVVEIFMILMLNGLLHYLGVVLEIKIRFLLGLSMAHCPI